MRLTALVAALALAAGFAAPAWAEVDVEVPANFKVKGTLDPSEVERFRFHAEEGTVLTLAASAAKGSTLDFNITLATDVGVPVGVPDPLVTDTGGKFAIKGLVIPATGDYQVVLAGAGSGGYSLSLKAKPQTIWTRTLGFGGAGLAQFTFAMPAGSTVSLLAKPAAGSGTVARLVSLDPVGSSIDLTSLGSKTATTHAVTVGPLAAGGDFILTVSNEGGAGDIEVAAKVKPPKTKPGKLDLRGAVLGRPTGGETFVGRMLDGAGGIVTVGGAAGDLNGAKVVLPPGALAGPTLVSIASSLPPPIGDPDDQAAGPAVLLGPSGLTFPVPAVLTLPVDFSKIPGDATINDVRILIVEDNGSSRIVLPTGFASGTVTVETSGLSVCCPIVVSGPPNYGYTSLGTLKPGGDEFWMLQMAAELNTGSGNDSRNRKLEASIGQVSLRGDGTMDYSLANHGFQWSNQNSPPMSGQPIQAGLTEYTASDGGTLNWAYDATGTKIVLSGTPDNTPVFRVSRDGKYFAGAHEGYTQPNGDVQFGVRKNAKSLTTASLQGAWTMCFLELEANQNGSSGAAGPRPRRSYGTTTFDGAGNCTIAFTERRASFDESSGTTSQPSESVSVKNATYSIDVDGTIVVVVPPPKPGDTGTTLRVFPGEGLDVLFAGQDPPLGESAMAMVLVRQGSGLTRSDLAGRYHGVNFSVDMNSYGVPSTPLPIPDFNINIEALVGTFDGGAAADFTGDRFHVQRDTQTADGTLTENSSETFTVSVSVTSQGKASLAADGKVIGQATPDGQAVVLVSDTGSSTTDFGLFFLFRSPPVKGP